MPNTKITKEEACYLDIKSAMDAKQLNQAKIAKRLGTTQASISIYMRDIYRAKGDKILLLSDIIGINIFDIMSKHWREEYP